MCKYLFFGYHGFILKSELKIAHNKTKMNIDTVLKEGRQFCFACRLMLKHLNNV